MSVDPPPYYSGNPIPPPGYPAMPYPMPGQPKPPPKKFWYVIAAALIVVGIAALGAGIAMVLHANGVQPSAQHSFRAGESTTLHIDADETKVIYVANADATGGHRVNCQITGAESGEVDVRRYPGSVTLNDWDATFLVTPANSDDYTIRCTGAPSDTFGVGGRLSTATMVGGLVSSLAGAFVLVLGLSVLTVALYLRHRRRAVVRPY